jgi:hypothetical protein
MQPCFIAYGAAQNIDYVALHNRNSAGFFRKGYKCSKMERFSKLVKPGYWPQKGSGN